MAFEIVIPRLGWSMDEGMFGGWLKKEGDRVEPGEMLFTLESEKGVEEVGSDDGGWLRIPSNAPQPGDTVVVGELVGYLAEEGEATPDVIDRNVWDVQAVPELPDPESAGLTSVKGRNVVEAGSPAPAITPRARRVAMTRHTQTFLPLKFR